MSGASPFTDAGCTLISPKRSSSTSITFSIIRGINNELGWEIEASQGSPSSDMKASESKLSALKSHVQLSKSMLSYHGVKIWQQFAVEWFRTQRDMKRCQGRPLFPFQKKDSGALSIDVRSALPATNSHARSVFAVLEPRGGSKP